MIAILACMLAIQVPVEQPMRLRTILPNDSAILVERVPNARALSVQLFASSRGTEETPETNGLRHLLEHLISTGKNGDLDVRLETEGAFLRPRTLRDSMVFELELRPKDLGRAMATFKEILRTPSISQEQIDRELKILKLESALRDSFSLMAEAGWQQAYGETGLGTDGDPEVLSRATPEGLLALFRKQFAAQNLAVVIAGDVDLDEATAAASSLLSPMPKLPEQKPRMRQHLSRGNVEVDANGEAVAVPVGGYREVSTAAALAAGLALASEMQGAFLTYTPSADAGLITLGSLDRGQVAKALSEVDSVALFARGKQLGASWVDRQLTSPGQIAFWRGHLLVQARDLRPELLKENLEMLSQSQFRTALSLYGGSKAITIRGTR